MTTSKPARYAYAFLLATAVPPMANAQTTATSASAATPTTAAPYLAMAGASDQYEIQSSRLALQKAQSTQVKTFAQMMIDHHTRTTQTLMQAASSASLTPPPPKLLPEQTKMIHELQGLSGSKFDAAYLKQQRKAHDMAYALHSRYAEKGDVPSLRTAATSAVPIIRQHRDQLAQIK